MRIRDPRSQLDAIQRRGRWKLVLQGGGILLVIVGMVLLPVPRHYGFAKRDSSFFSLVADSGMFVRVGFGCIVAGVLALAGSLLIRADAS